MFCLKLDMNFNYKCCNVHFVPLKDEKEQIVLFKMNTKERIVHSKMNKLFGLSEIEKENLAITGLYITRFFVYKFPHKFLLGAILVRKCSF